MSYKGTLRHDYNYRVEQVNGGVINAFTTKRKAIEFAERAAHETGLYEEMVCVWSEIEEKNIRIYMKTGHTVDVIKDEEEPYEKRCL